MYIPWGFGPDRLRLLTYFPALIDRAGCCMSYCLDSVTCLSVPLLYNPSTHQTFFYIFASLYILTTYF